MKKIHAPGPGVFLSGKRAGSLTLAPIVYVLLFSLSSSTL